MDLRIVEIPEFLGTLIPEVSTSLHVRRTDILPFLSFSCPVSEAAPLFYLFLTFLCCFVAIRATRTAVHFSVGNRLGLGWPRVRPRRAAAFTATAFEEEA